MQGVIDVGDQLIQRPQPFPLGILHDLTQQGQGRLLTAELTLDRDHHSQQSTQGPARILQRLHDLASRIESWAAPVGVAPLSCAHPPFFSRRRRALRNGLRGTCGGSHCHPQRSLDSERPSLARMKPMYRRECAGHRARFPQRGSSSSAATRPGGGLLFPQDPGASPLWRRRATRPASLTRTRTACVDFTSSSTK